MTGPLLSEEVQRAIDRRIVFAIDELRESGVKAPAALWPKPSQRAPGQSKGDFMLSLFSFAEEAFQRSIGLMDQEQRQRARDALDALQAVASYAFATDPDDGTFTNEHLALLVMAGAQLGRLRLPGEDDVLSPPKKKAGRTKGAGSKVMRDAAAAQAFEARTGRKPRYSDWERGDVNGEKGRAVANRNSGVRGRNRRSQY